MQGVEPAKTDLRVVSIAFFSFVVLGVPAALLNVAWSPAIRETFGLSLDAVATLFLMGTLGYAGASSASGRLTTRLGVARLLTTSAVLGGFGAVGIALAPTWELLVLAGLLAAMGAGLLDGGMNIFFAANYGPRLMSWLHASFGIGATLAPLLMTVILERGGTWRLGYGVAALLYGVLALLFAATRGRWHLTSAVAASEPLRMATVAETLRLSPVWLGIGLFVAYTGLEASAGQWSFSLFTEGRRVAEAVAGVWVGIYWGSFTVGRFLFGGAVGWVRPVTLIRLCLAGAVLGTVLLACPSPPGAAFFGLALLGFSLSPIFALMISGTQERLGPVHAPNAIGLQVAAAGAGLGVLPGLAGVLAKSFGLEAVPYFLLAVVLLMILLFEAIQRQQIGRPAA